MDEAQPTEDWRRPFDQLSKSLRRANKPEQADYLHDLVHNTAYTTGSDMRATILEFLEEVGHSFLRHKGSHIPGLVAKCRALMRVANS